MKNYNHFTIDYIKAVQKHLKIELVESGEAIFVPKKVSQYEIMNLSVELTEIFKRSESSLDVVKGRNDSIIQAGLFGMVNNLDKAVKVGFLIADRVVLIDYLYERILSKRINKIDMNHLGSIASSLVQLLPLAEKGRIVIIPNPFNWFEPSKEIISEVSSYTVLDIKLISMLNMLSITNECKLHPYTIAESEAEYNLIVNEQLDRTDVLGKSIGKYAYEGILGSLLSEKLLDKIEFKIALERPITNYYDIISSNSEFYNKYIQQITSRGEIEGELAIDELKGNIIENIADRNNKLPTKIKNLAIIGTSAGGVTTAILGVISLVSAPIAITGAFASIAPSLLGLLNSKDRNEEPIINVFSNLINSDN